MKEIAGARLRRATLNQDVRDKVNDALADRKITYQDIARKTGTSRSNISRALRGEHNLTLGNLERICEAAGLKIEFSVTTDEPPDARRQGGEGECRKRCLMKSTADYVVGFAFESGLQTLLLIEKKRPDWQRGRLNGCGGVVPAGESPSETMRRKGREETGYDIPEWHHFATLVGREGGQDGGRPFRVFFFHARYTVATPHAKPTHDEEVKRVSPSHLPGNTFYNARWLIQMALTMHGDKAQHFLIVEQYREMREDEEMQLWVRK